MNVIPITTAYMIATSTKASTSARASHHNRIIDEAETVFLIRQHGETRERPLGVAVLRTIARNKGDLVVKKDDPVELTLGNVGK